MISKETIYQVNIGRYVLGVTGMMCSGKTHTCKQIYALASSQGINTTYLDFDTARRSLLGPGPSYMDIKTSLADRFGKDIMAQDNAIDREALGKIIFYNTDAMKFFKQTAYTAIMDSLSKDLSNKKGLVLFEWAMLVEDGFMPLVDNNVLLVKCLPELQQSRMREFDISYDQAKKRIETQLSADEKDMMIKDIHKRSRGNSGKLYIFDTTNNPGEKEHMLLLEKIIEEI
jgi:dephospho-CoA kinase